MIEPMPMFAVARSPQWSMVRRLHLEANGFCAACGGTKELEVHHIRPYHLFPELELAVANLITLCNDEGRSCHYCFGHCFDWHSYNETVIHDAALWLYKVSHRARK